MNNMRIIFMGTPAFAVGILDAMLKNKYNVVAVITAPDKPAGRGQKMNTSAVKDYALEYNLNILQPTNLKNENFVSELNELKADLQIVVAFRMLPEVVWKMPKIGTINLHASLLPDYRGAAPINWAIINGETKTGVTTFFIDDKIDTGAIILKKEIEIQENTNAGVLHDQLIELGAKTVIETLQSIENKSIKTILQPAEEQIKTAYKLNKENCKINYEDNVNSIYNLIRGLTPYPAAWCYFYDEKEEWNVKIYEAEKIIENHNEIIGFVKVENKSIFIYANGGILNIKSLQFPNKKRLTAQELLNGIKFNGKVFVK
jgi:methionyl-tRNA formyltransferase